MLSILRQKTKGHAIIEYMVLIALVITAILIMQKYLTRNFSGQLKETGDSFGYGRQYSYLKTLECANDDDGIGWYNVSCYDASGCASKCHLDPFYCQGHEDNCELVLKPACVHCKQSCITPKCN